jgi:hypothetical protein
MTSYAEHRMTKSVHAKQYLLKQHPKQRPDSDTHIEDLANLMLKGNFCQDMNDAICINTRGELCNGQNRLYALIKASEINPDITIRMLFLLDQDPDAFPYMDGNGLARRMEMRLSFFRSEPKSVLKKYTSLIRFAMRELYHLNPKVEIDEINKYADKHKAILDWATARDPEDNKAFVGTEFVMSMIEMHLMNPAKAREFRRHVLSGASLPEKHPALVLRTFLMANEASRLMPRRKEIYYKCIRAVKEYLSAGEAGQIRGNKLTIDEWEEETYEMLKSMFAD